ncbi:MAG: ADP-ribosylglycohydrolase family protein [Aestuariivirga sp.]|nr:ADP-ribosylglycohydrolase family protein [Aestuariivirga sp.]
MAETGLQRRAMGALAGVAIGDAMGMPTQTLPREEIARLYGRVDGFRDAAAGQPVSAGLRAGTVTDDTEQSILLARHIIARGGRMDQRIWADELLAWERDTHARGVNDLLGPSTKRAIESLQRGVPVSETGRHGTTNGAAMRIVPVAVATRATPLSGLVDAVEESCRLTHNTSEAIGAASAVAAAVSLGIEGAGLDVVFGGAIAAAAAGERRGTSASKGSISRQIADALAAANGQSGQAGAVAIAERFGTGVSALESVPVAFAILRLTHADPWRSALFSAAIGDDTDTIGAIACGMAGACRGIDAIPGDAWKLVREVNSLDLEPLVSGLLRIRQQRSGPRA